MTAVQTQLDHNTMDDPASHLDFLLGDRFTDADPEAASLRSHPSSHAADPTLSLLPHPPTRASPPSRSQTQRLQRRRNQYYYVNGNLPNPATGISSPASTAQQQQQQQQQFFSPRSVNANQEGAGAGAAPHKRTKSYSPSSHASSWLLGSAAGAFADTKRQSWTGERRESRKLQKDHPVGSARPSCTFAIGDGDEITTSASGAAERDGVRGSVLGVRRKMERLRGLYRRGEKEVEVSSNLR